MATGVGLQASLERLRYRFAMAAQHVFDRWVEWPDGCCDTIANEMCSIIAWEIPDVTVLDGSPEGDDHAYLIVYDDVDACGVDLPYYHYERGGGYSWQPLTDAEITPDMIVIWPIQRKDVVEL